MNTFRNRLRFGALLAASLGSFLSIETAHAACNVIPEAKQKFRGQVGSVDSAFGRPDGVADVGVSSDPRRVDVTAGTCPGNPKFEDKSGDGVVDAKDYVVTVVFEPPRGGDTHVVGLTAGAECPVCDNGRKRECLSGANAGIVLEPTVGRLLFRFPDTAPFYPAPGSDRTFTGPAKIAVSPANEALPCKLATYACGDPLAPAGLTICIDALYQAGGCGTTPADRNARFGSFTALPTMNDWQDVCDESPDGDPTCKNKKPDVRFTVDAAGNILLPVSWAGILENDPSQPGKKRKREMEGATKIAPTKNGSGRIHVPDNSFLSSSTAQGASWPERPPLFEIKPGTSHSPWLEFIGEADEPESVLRISRRELWGHRCDGGADAGQACRPDDATPCRKAACVASDSPAYFACAGGPRAGQYCTSPGDCPSGKCVAGSKCYKRGGAVTATACTTDAQCKADEECGLGIFEFRDQLADGVGPVQIPKAKYKARAGKYKR